MPSVRVLLLGLIGVQILAMVVLGMAGSSSWQAPQPQRTNAETLQPVTISAGAGPVGGQVDLVERPLFVPGRRPIVPTAEVHTAELPKDLTLQGIYGTGAEDGGVILSYSGKVRRVAVGQKFEAITLIRVDGIHAFFLNDGREMRLSLRPLERPEAEVDRQPALVQPPNAQGQAVEGQAAEGQDRLPRDPRFNFARPPRVSVE